MIRKKKIEDGVVEGNAKKFINAYNKIDRSLRVQYNLKRGQSFSDIIRRCTSINSIVRKFEDELVDYARLRNAIIHGSDDNKVIAEPRTSVVNNIEKIADLIDTPPLAINNVCRKDISIVSPTTKVREVVAVMYNMGYSNLPVYDGDNLLGIANGQRILDFIGKLITNGTDIDEFLENTNIIDIIQKDIDVKYYAVVDTNLTIEDALNMFYNNRKLLAILITKNGSYSDNPIGIITVSDIIDLNAILDNYIRL